MWFTSSAPPVQLLYLDIKMIYKVHLMMFQVLTGQNSKSMLLFTEYRQKKKEEEEVISPSLWPEGEKKWKWTRIHLVYDKERKEAVNSSGN